MALLSLFGLWGLLIGFFAASTHRFITDNPDSVPDAPLGIVFGAGIRGGIPSIILKNRLDGAIQLYRRGKVKKLLMSGDNRSIYYNEPKAMRKYALAHSVADKDILLDFAGRDTYDTCFRAKSLFKANRAVLITQAYHLPRAIYLSRSMGIQATGFAVPNLEGHHGLRVGYAVREAFADIKAVWDFNFLHRHASVDDQKGKAG